MYNGFLFQWYNNKNIKLRDKTSLFSSIHQRHTIIEYIKIIDKKHLCIDQKYRCFLPTSVFHTWLARARVCVFFLISGLKIIELRSCTLKSTVIEFLVKYLRSRLLQPNSMVYLISYIVLRVCENVKLKNTK